jgi:hypothetical protein
VGLGFFGLTRATGHGYDSPDLPTSDYEYWTPSSSVRALLPAAPRACV